MSLPASEGAVEVPLRVMSGVLQALAHAYAKHPERHSSPHESYAVLLEEVEELWHEVKAENRERAREEAMQVAACAIRMIVDSLSD